MKKITLIESHRRKLLGENLGSCSEEELQELGNQLEESLSQIRKRKVFSTAINFIPSHTQLVKNLSVSIYEFLLSLSLLQQSIQFEQIANLKEKVRTSAAIYICHIISNLAIFNFNYKISFYFSFALEIKERGLLNENSVLREKVRHLHHHTALILK